MGFRITVAPGRHAFEGEPGETILDAALRHGLLLPHECRDGACGSCRGKVLSGSVDHGRVQPQPSRKPIAQPARPSSAAPCRWKTW